jgi:hypothetical protein
MYYLVIIQNNNTQSIFSYQTIDEALSVFHTELAYRGETRNSTVCVILEETGALIKRDSWQRPTNAQTSEE